MLRITDAPSLASLTTLRLGGRAVALVEAPTVEAAAVLPRTVEALGGKVRVLGRGSNILAHDGELACVLVRQRIADVPQVVGEEGNTVFVRVGAACPLPRLVVFCARHGLAGLEGLAGVPGEVGGGIAMNAGAMGNEIAACLARLDYVSPQTGLAQAGPEDFSYAYRHFVLKSSPVWWLATSAVFALTRGNKMALCDAVKGNLRKKAATQPLRAHSAGCVFKNPAPDMPAGRLLDAAGCKGKQLGGMAFSTIHANFLINLGTGTATQALALIAQAQQTVAARFGQTLELEVQEWQ